MGNNLIGKLAQWAWALEATTVGLELEPTAGIPNLNKAVIDYGQEWQETTKQTGTPMLRTLENIKGPLNPSWAPETTFTIPFFGQLMAHLCHKSAESGTYVQTIEPIATSGKEVTYGATRTGNAVYSSTIKQKMGQTARDVGAFGGIITRIDVTIPEFGLVKVTPHFLFFDLITNDTAAGTWTLPASSTEKLASDFVYKLGDGTPAALYSKEITFSMIADVVVKRYGGVGATTDPGILPARFVYNGWSLEGSMSKPVAAATDTIARDFLISGGETGGDQLMYVYSRTMADYSATPANNECIFTFNIKIDSATFGLDDEVVENVTFKGIHDGTNNIFQYKQGTTGTQATWATQS